MTFEGHFSTVVTLRAQLTRDLLAIAKFFVSPFLPTTVSFEVLAREVPCYL